MVLAGLSFRHRPEELEVLAAVRREQQRLGVKENPELIQDVGAIKPADILPVHHAEEISPK